MFGLSYSELVERMKKFDDVRLVEEYLSVQFILNLIFCCDYSELVILDDLSEYQDAVLNEVFDRFATVSDSRSNRLLSSFSSLLDSVLNVCENLSNDVGEEAAPLPMAGAANGKEC